MINGSAQILLKAKYLKPFGSQLLSNHHCFISLLLLSLLLLLLLLLLLMLLSHHHLYHIYLFHSFFATFNMLSKYVWLQYLSLASAKKFGLLGIMARIGGKKQLVL